MDNDKTKFLEAAPGDDSPSPQPLQKYRFGCLVGQGGMGVVHYAEDQTIRRTVAMKMLLDERKDSVESRLRFTEEAQITGQLEHPGIVPIYELGTDPDGRVFYTMKFVNGVTLSDVLQGIRDGQHMTIAKYPLGHLLTIFQKICDAVAFAHSKGVVHRDLKPDNIMIGEFGEVVVMDWGLAKLLGSENRPEIPVRTAVSSARADEAGKFKTMDGAVIGTPNYMAPEQAMGKLEAIDARTDIFALGAILYNILTLRPPVSGSDLKEVLTKICTGQIHPPTVFNQKRSSGYRAQAETEHPPAELLHCPARKVPSALSAVTMKALAVEPAHRYQTVPELQSDVEAWQNGYATAAEEAGFGKHALLLLKRHKSAAAASMIIFLLLIGFVTAVVVGNKKLKSTLKQLEATAPTFYNQAGLLLEDEKPEEALEKISFALTLSPNDGEYHRLRGNILQTLLRLEEAQAAYRLALRCNAKDESAATNLTLCAKILREKPDGAGLTLDSIQELHAALLKQKRSAEALVLMRRILAGGHQTRVEIKQLIETWKAKLQAEDIPPKGLTYAGSNQLALRISRPMIDSLSALKGMPLASLSADFTRISDLSPLQDMPLRALEVNNTLVTDLTPLEGLPLTKLNIGATRVSDLSPLQGMPLRELSLAQNRAVTDLSPLGGLPLTTLDLGHTDIRDISALRSLPLKSLKLDGAGVSDISVLRGLPLETLSLEGCVNVENISPLADCQRLEQLILPPRAKNIEFLRRLPRLKYLSYRSPKSGTPATKATEFWQAYDAQKKK